MKKFLFYIILFFTIVFAVDIVVGYVGDYIQAHAKRGETKRTNNLVKIDKNDIVILGSSRARYHYDAPFISDTLNLKAYNAGYEGRGVIFAYGLLSMILHHDCPKLIIYDVNPDYDMIINEEDANNKRYIRDLKPYWREDIIGEVIRDVSTEEWYKVHSGMLRYNTVFLQMLIDSYGMDYETGSGFIPLQGVYNWESESINYDATELDALKIKYMGKLLRLANQHKVPVIVVASPKYGQTSSELLKPIMDICKENNVPFVDYWAHESFMAHKEWFNDPLHLNFKGARLFNRLIIGDLKKNIISNDTRQDTNN